MDEKYINALLSAVSRQRDQALNAIAQLEAQIAVMREELEGLKNTAKTVKEE